MLLCHSVYLILFIGTFSCDSGAYFTGITIGRHKMNKRISPKKTWEGFAAGAFFAMGMGLLNAQIFQKPKMSDWLVIAAIVVIFGTLGDLFESKIKRKLRVKDSGTVLPGHGGLLDRLDSLLFVG